MSAAYVSLVSRACPCLTNEEFIRYYLPQERGWAYVHQFLIESGSDMRWPETSANAEGRWWNRVLATFGL